MDADMLRDRNAEIEADAKAEAWDAGYSCGWSDAQDAHDVRQEMDREDWPLCTPNPHREEVGNE